MICHVGIASEFKDCFSKGAQKRLYGGIWNTVDGLYHRGQAWIFIDRIAVYGLSDRYNIIDEITNTVIHELIHLCGVVDERMAILGEWLVK